MKRRLGMLVGANAMALLAVVVGVSACGDSPDPTVVNACGSVSPTCASGANPVIGDSTGANPYCPIGSAGQAIDPQSGVVIGSCDTIQGCYVACVYWQKCPCGVTEVTGSGFRCADCLCADGDRRCGVTATAVERCENGKWVAESCPTDTRCTGSPPVAICQPDCPEEESWCENKCRNTREDVEWCGPTCEKASPCSTADPNAEAYCNNGDCQWKCLPGYEPETSIGPCVSDCAGFPDEVKWCKGKCRDTQNDPDMCGPNCEAASSCPPGDDPNATRVCTNGVCSSVCTPGLTNCSGTCVDTDSDWRNCGACGIQCPNTNGIAGCTQGQCTLTCKDGFINCPQEGPGGGCETNMFTTTKYCVVKDEHGDYQCYLAGQQKPTDPTLKCDPALTPLAWSPRPEYVCDPPFTCGHGSCVVVAGQAQCNCDSGYIPSLNGKSCIDANYGTGKDGSKHWTISETMATVSTRPTAAPAAGATALSVASTSGFGAGDYALVIDLQGSQSVGFWELVVVQNISASSLHLKFPLHRSYPSTDKIIVQRVPQYLDVTVDSGVTVSAPKWTGESGGVLAFVVQGTLTLNGTLSMVGAGYRGGRVCLASNTGNMCLAEDGEGYLGAKSSPDNTAANANGGGGPDASNCPWGSWVQQSGGGHVNNGANGATTPCGFGGVGGAKYPFNVHTHERLVMGGGMGGGVQSLGVNPEMRTPSGGGVILVLAAKVAPINGAIDARADDASWGALSPGAGSAAGTIVVGVPTGSVDVSKLNVYDPGSPAAGHKIVFAPPLLQ